MKQRLLLTLVFASPFFGMRAPAQSAGMIYGMHQDSAGAAASLVAFDCSTLRSSVIHTFTGLPAHDFVGAGWVDHTAIDPYNRRLFWCGHSGSDLIIRTLDLSTFQTTVSLVLPTSNAYSLTYDCYNNRLLMKGSKELLLGYDLPTDIVDTVSPIPFIYYGSMSPENAFDAYDQQYICTKICTISPPAP